jgi:hypothetical protein
MPATKTSDPRDCEHVWKRAESRWSKRCTACGTTRYVDATEFQETLARQRPQQPPVLITTTPANALTPIAPPPGTVLNKRPVKKEPEPSAEAKRLLEALLVATWILDAIWQARVEPLLLGKERELKE